MAPGDAAQHYHELTSVWSMDDWRTSMDDPRVVRGFVTDVLETFPDPCKSYPAGLSTVALPAHWEPGRDPATAVLAGAASPSPGIPGLRNLARVLHLSAGVIRTADRPDGRHYKLRASGSAGGRFPLEVYVSAHRVDGLADGVYWFDPLGHALLPVGPPAEGDATTLVVTGVPWRTGWRYVERGLRHVYWDAGAMLANLLAVAEDAGLRPRLRAVFPDESVTRLVGADGVHEFPLAIVSLGDGEPAIGPGGEAQRGAVDRRAPLEFPLVTDTQHAGDVEALGEPRPEGAPLPGPVPASAGLDEVILRRSSTRIMDTSRAIPRAVLEWSLAASLRGCELPHFVAVHAVEGVAPGLYRWPALDAPVRAGDLRHLLFRVCGEQELGRDAAFVVIGAADLGGMDDRGYRVVQLEAGIVDGRLHIAAFALGVGATGMTFIDAELLRLIGEPLAGLLLTCVGVPAYRHRPGGPPRAPVRMRPLRPAA